MRKDKHIKSYTAEELRAAGVKSGTDWQKVDAVTDDELERHIAEDKDERDMRPDWTKAELVLPKAKQSVHLRLDSEIISFFKSQGRGHIARMQAVLKAYADAHRPHAK